MPPAAAMRIDAPDNGGEADSYAKVGGTLALPPDDPSFPRRRRPALDELRLQLRTALPSTASFLLGRFPWLVSLAFVGRIGPDELAAAALATTLCNVTGMSLGVGLSAAMQTLAGQAVGKLLAEGERRRGGRFESDSGDGSGDEEGGEEEKKDEAGGTDSSSEADVLLPSKRPKAGIDDRRVPYKSFSMDVDLEAAAERRRREPREPLMPLAYLCRGIFVQMVLIVPVGIWWLTGVKSVLIRLGQGERVSAMTEQYLRILTPGLWSYGISMTLNTWLQTVGLADVPVYAIAACLALHIPFNVLFIRVLAWDYLGAAAATVAFQFLQPVLVAAYLFGTDRGRERMLDRTGAKSAGYARLTFRREAKFAVGSLPGISQYLSLGLPGIVVISEWWASEVSIFLSGRLQPHPSFALDGMTIYQSLNAFCFQLSQGMSVAGAARVGQCLGGGDGAGARLASRVSASGAAFLGSMMGCVLYFAPHALFPSIFTSDEDVIREASRTISFLSVYVVADGVQCALSGAVKGCGRQYLMMPIVLVSYWAVGLPLGYYLSFVRHGGQMCDDYDGDGEYLCGVRGLVAGMTTGTWVHMMLMAGTLACTFDWAEEARRARRRLAAEKMERLREGATAANTEEEGEWADGGTRINNCGGGTDSRC